MPLVESDALPLGTVIGGYAVQRVLGQGGFGITYAAHNRVTNQQVAIKEFFPASLARRDGRSRLTFLPANAETVRWALRKFEETTTTLCRLSHPSIVQVYNYVPANDTGYMIMELLDGTTLEDWLAARPQPPSLAELRPLVAPVMEALAYVHGQGFIHRDIAPDNILITRQGRPVLIDFGSASRDLSVAQQATRAGTVGTYKQHYTAPEQSAAEAYPTPTADIYSLGAVLYRALSGTKPIDSGIRTRAIYLEGRPDPYPGLAGRGLPGCPEGAARAIDAALSLRPDARPASMAAFRAALDSADPLAGKAPGTGPDKPQESPGPKKPWATVAWLTGGGAAGFAAVAVAAFLVISTNQRPPAPAQPPMRAPAPTPAPTTQAPAPTPAPTTQAPAPTPAPTTQAPAPTPAPTTQAPAPTRPPRSDPGRRPQNEAEQQPAPAPSPPVQRPRNATAFTSQVGWRLTYDSDLLEFMPNVTDVFDPKKNSYTTGWRSRAEGDAVRIYIQASQNTDCADAKTYALSVLAPRRNQIRRSEATTSKSGFSSYILEGQGLRKGASDFDENEFLDLALVKISDRSTLYLIQGRFPANLSATYRTELVKMMSSFRTPDSEPFSGRCR